MEIVYTNDGGESITLSPSRPYFLTRVDGTGAIKQTINTFKAPNQDGAFFISGTLDMRNVTLEGAILARTIDEAYLARQALLRVFSPKMAGTLVYRGKQIPCNVEEVGFSVSNGERSPSFLISLLCPSPFFEEIEALRVELAAWTPTFSFELEIPESGIEFGVREPSQIITVDNEGDVPCGCTVVFKALMATVQNPELMNVDTGEVIRINRTLAAGEEIRVDTYFAAKRVTSVLVGAETNAFSDLDTDSTFLQLAVGRNTLRYSAATNMDLLEVTIHYRPQYLGV
jgi:hypothetical protein